MYIELLFQVKISARSTNSSTNQYHQEQFVFLYRYFRFILSFFSFRQNTLTFDFLNTAVQCPLPDSDPSTPENNTENFNFTLPENSSSQIVNHSSNIERQYKLIQIDGNTSFYLIRYNNNKPYIPCFNLARLLQLSESDILSETVEIILHTHLNLLWIFVFSYYHVFVLHKHRKIVQHLIV